MSKFPYPRGFSYLSSMDPVTHMRTKDMLIRDFALSGKDLGDFALDYMEIYDDYLYELSLTDATSRGKKVGGTAFLGSCEDIERFLEKYEISGAYTIDVIDTQKEFFIMLQEIKDDMEDALHPNKCYNAVLKEIDKGVPGVL